MTKPAEHWETLTPDRRLEARLEAWAAAPGITFDHAETAAAYRERVGIIADALALRRPSRVPVCPMFGVYPLAYAGVSVREAMYDYDRFAQAWLTFHADFPVDTVADPIPSGRVYETIGYRQYRWPGHGVDDRTGYQYVEGEYMQAGEYGRLAGDPTGFLLGSYLPRIAGAFAALAGLAPLLDLMEGPGVAVCLSQFGTPEMQGALRALLDAGAESLAWLEAVGAVFTELASRLGMPAFSGGMTKAPFDVVGDTFRGTRGIIRDRFQRPRELGEALRRLVPLCIEQGVAGGDATGCPLIFLPLHKGADGFLSDEDYREFYWPTLKAVVLGLIEDGLVPLLFAEGAYNRRLAVIADDDIPAGRAIWLFDATDMVAARRALDGRACIGGNVPGTLLELGSPGEVEDYVARLVAAVAGDGGFILSTGTTIDEAKPENVAALVSAGHACGRG
ncbi:MAG TPA: uroporphyrinogen decarboxylase family protein [Thermoleophilia bacterium]|nr:uroporphyrinogen decarboxylase family protein [Thermoleophilia bacterium]